MIDDFGDRLAGDLGVTDLVRGLGGCILRGLAPGQHQLHVEDEPAVVVDVPTLGARPPDYEQRVLGQVLQPGYGYLEVRDGTLLSINVGLPDPDRWGPGPHPTVVQYSGYHPSRPDFLTGDPAHDTGMNTEANVCLHLGYAVVGVNMRGSGGSGGAFQLLGPLAGLDGHDAVEVIARQRWARRRADGRPAVGMIGRSMPGYSQVLVASTRPPSLAVITPAAVGAHPYDALAPGGVPNAWLQARIGFWEVDPAPPEGEVRSGMAIEGRRYEFWDLWLKDWIREHHDVVAAENQLLRGHNVDLRPLLAAHNTAEAEDPLRIDIGAWAEQVEASTLLMGTWQDQDSGAGFGMIPSRFPADTEVRVLAGNGTHEESRLPAYIARWAEHLDVRLAERTPAFGPEAQEYLDRRYEAAFPAGLPVRPSDLSGVEPDAAAAALDARPPVTVLLEVGADPTQPAGYPAPATELAFDAWPPKRTPWRLHLGPDGALGESQRVTEAVTTWRYDPRVHRPASADEGFDVNVPQPDYDWRPLVRGASAAFVTEPLEEDLLLIGPASLDLWVSCTAPDVDLEVTVTEVRPDGEEVFVQSGWLRLSARALDPERSSPLVPWLAEDRPADQPLDGDEVVSARVPVGWLGHLFREHSRLRVSVAAPGGNQPHWTFRALWPDGRHHGRPVEVQVHHGGDRPSAFVVPRVEVDPPTGTWPPLPAAGALRRQPCRRYVPDGVEVDPEVGPEPRRQPEPPPDPPQAGGGDDVAPAPDEVRSQGRAVSPAPRPAAWLRRLLGRVRRLLGRVVRPRSG